MYCGASFEARTVYPLNFIGAVIFLRMTPLTRPASEFQLTWSPILNPPRMKLSSRPRCAGRHESAPVLRDEERDLPRRLGLILVVRRERGHRELPQPRALGRVCDLAN